MTRAPRYLAALTLTAALPALAQDAAEADRGFLTGLIERNLSTPGQAVRLEGFAGALSSRATFARLTIADGDGVWLSIRDGAISWNRGALLRGRVEVAELSAAEIDISRRPVAPDTPGLPEAGAQPFRLPELPVSVEIGSVLAESVHLAAPVMGTEVTLRLAGLLSLAGGEGSAGLRVERIDGTRGQLSLDASFVNASRTLALDFVLSEPQGGIAATALNLPGRPAMELGVKGQGPLADFFADIAVASDGAPRLSGGLRLTEDAAATRSFALDLAGDLAPLFLPDFRPFFGPDVRLTARGAQDATGATRLDALRIDAAAMTLDGRLTLAPDGLPRDFAVDARIADPGGGTVRLPVAGPAVAVDRAEIRLEFDAARGDRWQGSATLARLAVGADRVESATLKAEGEITRAPGGRQVTARLQARAEGIAPAAAELAAAIGDALDLTTEVQWREGEALQLSDLRVQTPTARLVATGAVGALDDGLPFDVRGTLNLPDLGAFSGLAGQRLAGRAILALNGRTHLLDGRFDLRAGGTGRDISAGIEPVDRLLAGQSRIGLDARRDETSITLRRAEVTANGARIAAGGLLREGATALAVSADLDEAGRAFAGLSGPGSARATLRQTGPGAWSVDAAATGPGAASVRFAGALREAAEGALSAEGRLTAQVADLSAYAAASKRRLRGALDLTAEGAAGFNDRRFDVTLDLTGRNLGFGHDTLDRLIGGDLALSAAVAQERDTLTVSRLTLDAREVTAEASGRLDDAGARIEGQARLRDLAALAPDFPGPLSLRGSFGRAPGGRWVTDLSAQGPGGTTAAVAGTLSADFAAADLTIRGEAPLGLANAALAPNVAQGRAQFDLRLNGAPGLGALSGRITTAGARVSAPIYGVAVSDLGGAATLAEGQASVDVAGNVEGGGRVAVAGRVGLAAPNPSDLRLTLTDARIADPALFETRVSGALGVTGPLTGGARIAGTLDLGETEIRVAPTGLGTGDIPEGLRHVNEPAAVRLTRARAGLIGGPGAGAPARPFALDLLVRAPNRIFVRGRGLDAELGGALRLTGTTAAVVPQGQFDLIRGRLDILGRRLAFDEGAARLEGTFDPYLRLVAVTEAEETSVRVVVEGPASEPVIRFESAPELPEDEVLARLIFGRAITDLSPLQAARLASAVAQLSGRGGSGLVDRLRQNFGLDDLDITTGADGGAGVRAGRYLSENVYSEVTVDSEGRADISINLDLSSSVTVKGRAGSDGETGLGIFYERDY